MQRQMRRQYAIEHEGILSQILKADIDESNLFSWEDPFFRLPKRIFERRKRHFDGARLFFRLLGFEIKSAEIGLAADSKMMKTVDQFLLLFKTALMAAAQIKIALDAEQVGRFF